MDDIKTSIESGEEENEMEEPMSILLMEPETILTTQDNDNLGKLISFKVLVNIVGTLYIGFVSACL